MTEDEMVGWHHQLNGHEFEQVPGDGEGQGSLQCRRHRQMQVQFPGWEDPLEKGMATLSSILAWRFPWINSQSTE